MIENILMRIEISFNDVRQRFFSKFNVHQNHLEGLLRHNLLGPPSVSYLVDLGEDTKLCISNQFLGNTNNVGSGVTLRELLYIWIHVCISNTYTHFHYVYIMVLKSRSPLFQGTGDSQ